MPRDSYMPDKQAQQVDWAANFNSIVGASAAAYGVPVTTMTAFAAIVATLQSAWTAASEPTTRTRVAVDAKNVALDSMKLAARNIVSVIRGTPA